MRGVEQFTRETNLTKRVNEWEMRMLPQLEVQDQHSVFDINSNKGIIVKELKAMKKEEASVKELAGKREPYEICRMFVSLLQMVSVLAFNNLGE